MRAHGTVNFRWDSDILIVDISGSFNLQGAEVALRKHSDIIAISELDKWYRILVYHADAFAPKEVFDLLNDSESHDKATGCCGVVYVFSSAFQQRLRQSNISDVLSKKFVMSLEQAYVEINKMRADDIPSHSP